MYSIYPRDSCLPNIPWPYFFCVRSQAGFRLLNLGLSTADPKEHELCLALENSMGSACPK